jgi:hypothetical protein
MTREQIGSVAEEAAKLFAALRRDDRHEHEGNQTHRLGPECQWCPLCQLMYLVRHSGPETVEQLASAASGVLGSLRSLLDAAAESARAKAAEDRRRETKATDEPLEAAEAKLEESADKPERIDVSEDPGRWD